MCGAEEESIYWIGLCLNNKYVEIQTNKKSSCYESSSDFPFSLCVWMCVRVCVFGPLRCACAGVCIHSVSQYIPPRCSSKIHKFFRQYSDTDVVPLRSRYCEYLNFKMIKQVSAPVCSLLRACKRMGCGNTDPAVECCWCSVLTLFTAVLGLDRSAFPLPNGAKRGKVPCDKESSCVWVYSPETLRKWRSGLLSLCRWKDFWLSSLSLPPPIRSVLALSEALWKAFFWFQMVSSHS